MSSFSRGSWESLGLQGDPTSPFWRRSALGVLWKEWCWSWNSSTLATSCEELTHWKRLWCWEGLGEGGEGDNSGWDGWMASLTRWTWTPGVGDGQGGLACCISWGRKESDTTEGLNWTELKLVPGSRINVLNLITLCLFFLYCHCCIFWDQQAEVVSHWFNWYSFILVLCSYVILEETGGLYFVLVVFSVA